MPSGYGQPGVIEKVTFWNSETVAQYPPNTAVPISIVPSPVTLAVTVQTLPWSTNLLVKWNPIEVTVPRIGPRAKTIPGHSKSNSLPSSSFFRLEL